MVGENGAWTRATLSGGRITHCEAERIPLKAAWAEASLFGARRCIELTIRSMAALQQAATSSKPH